MHCLALNWPIGLMVQGIWDFNDFFAVRQVVSANGLHMRTRTWPANGIPILAVIFMNLLPVLEQERDGPNLVAIRNPLRSLPSSQIRN